MNSHKMILALFLSIFSLSTLARDKTLSIPKSQIEFKLNKDAEIKEVRFEVRCYEQRYTLNPMVSKRKRCEDFKINDSTYYGEDGKPASGMSKKLNRIGNSTYLLPDMTISFNRRRQAFACMRVFVRIKGNFYDEALEMFADPRDYYSLLSYCTNKKKPDYIGYDMDSFFTNRVFSLDLFTKKLNDPINLLLKL